MHRVELKEKTPKNHLKDYLKTFLMHRVELKVLKTQVSQVEEVVVPNAPCGVESFMGNLKKVWLYFHHRS